MDFLSTLVRRIMFITAKVHIIKKVSDAGKALQFTSIPVSRKIMKVMGFWSLKMHAVNFTTANPTITAVRVFLFPKLPSPSISNPENFPTTLMTEYAAH